MSDYLDVAISTIDDPIKFFKALFETDLLNRLRDEFMPVEEEGSWIMQYPHTIDIKNEKYTIEYQIEKSGHEEDSTWVVDEYEPVEATFTFEEFLVERIEREILQSKLLLRKNAENIKSRSTESRLQKYPKVQFAVNQLSFLLLPNVENLVGAITDKGFESRKEIVNRLILSPDIFDSIANCTDDRGETLIDYDSYGSLVKPKTISSALENIFFGYVQRVRVPLNFSEQWPKMAVDYIFGKLNDYTNKMNLKIVEASKKVFIGKTRFNADSSYVNYKRFKDERLKPLIDQLFEDHLIK
jgi:hypothetical protein